MSSKNKPSGAEFRKRKKEALEKVAKLPKIDIYFKKEHSNCSQKPDSWQKMKNV